MQKSAINRPANSDQFFWLDFSPARFQVRNFNPKWEIAPAQQMQAEYVLGMDIFDIFGRYHEDQLKPKKKEIVSKVE